MLDGGDMEQLQEDASGEACSTSELVDQLEVGSPAFLDLNPNGDLDQRFRTVFQGWELGKYIVLKRPEACKALTMAKGRLCAVRFISNGDVWGFFASLRSELRPFTEDHTILVTWPKGARRLRVRRYERISLGIPCEVSFQNGGTEPGKIEDLSAGGCRVRVSRALELGDVAELTFEMPQTGEAMRRTVLIRNRSAGTDGIMQYGCQFQEEADDAQCGIEYYVARALADSRGEEPPHPPVFVLSSDKGDAVQVRHALRNTGYDIIAAGSVLNLGARMEHAKPVGLLISGALPDIEATAACRLVRRTEGYADLPVVIFGGDPSLERKAIAAGASAWIKGPEEAASISHFFKCDELDEDNGAV